MALIVVLNILLKEQMKRVDTREFWKMTKYQIVANDDLSVWLWCIFIQRGESFKIVRTKGVYLNKCLKSYENTGAYLS